MKRAVPRKLSLLPSVLTLFFSSPLPVGIVFVGPFDKENPNLSAVRPSPQFSLMADPNTWPKPDNPAGIS